MDTLKQLVALKWKLALRGYQRDRSRLIGLVLLLLFATPATLGAAALCLLAFTKAPGRLPFELLNLVLTGVWVFWIAFPVFGFSLNETYDPTKLFVFPLTTTAIFFAGVLGGFLDLPVPLLLPLLIAAVAAFGRNVASFAIAVLALALFTLQTMAFSQTCLTALLGLLKSRRFQDAATILVPIICVGVYIGAQFITPMAALQVDWSHPEQLESLRITASLLWLPSGMTGAAIEHGSSGQYGLAFAFLGLLALVTAGTIALGGLLLRKVHLGEIDAGRPRRAEPRQRPARPSPGLVGTVLGRAPVAVRAMFVKELRHLWREPEMKAILVTFLLPVVMLVVAFELAPAVARPYAPLIAAASVFGTLHLAMNAFGHDRQGLEVLLSYPARRRDILLGKNLATGIITGVVTLVVLTVVVVLTGAAPVSLAAIPFIGAVILVLLAAGNFSSIYFPTRIPRRGENPYTQSVAKGCLTGFVRTLALEAGALVSAPILGGFLGPWLSGSPAWLLLTAPLSITYAIVVYRASLRRAERSLLRHEHRILQICAARED